MPTEKLPMRSHEAPQRERRSLVRRASDIVAEKPPTSSQISEPQFHDLAAFTTQLELKAVEPWQIVKSHKDEVRIELDDKIHGVPKYSVVVNSCLEFTVFVYNWPVPDDHQIYKEQKRSIKYVGIDNLLPKIENSDLCAGLPEDGDVLNEAITPTENPGTNLNTVVRHTVAKAINVADGEPHFEVTVIYRSAACDMLVDSEHPDESCNCSSAYKTVKRVARKKSKASAAPAKPKASLEACGPEKLRATVKSTRLQVKELEVRLKDLQTKIEQQGIGVSEGLEKDILKIMGGQSLEATPHLKFFWQEQMKL